MDVVFVVFLMKRRPPRSTRTGNTLSLHDALPFCYVPRFALYVQGMAALIGRVREAWPGKPRLLLGHSMGGLIATLLLIEHQRDFAAAALSGPAILTPAPLSRLTVWIRSEEHTSELQSLMRISYAVFCLKKKT